MSSNKPVSITTSQVTDHISPRLRNDIYAALLSGGGINSIENSLTQELQTSGWMSNLKEYMKYLLRSGECTTLDEIMARVMEKALGANGSNGITNGTNGTNGVNGVNGDRDHDGDGSDIDLKIPNRVIKEGSRVIEKELKKVCEITADDDK